MENLYDYCLESVIRDKYRASKAAKTENEVEDIVSTLSDKERRHMGFTKKDEKYKKPEEYKLLAKRFIERVDGKAVAFFDLNEYDTGYNAVVVTRHGEEYRGKGYASKAIQSGLKWYDKNRYRLKKPIIWWAEKNNKGFQRLAEKMGFKKDHSIEKSDDEWIRNNWIKYVYE